MWDVRIADYEKYLFIKRNMGICAYYLVRSRKCMFKQQYSIINGMLCVVHQNRFILNL